MPAPDSKFLYNQIGATVANGTTFYVEVPVNNGAIGAQIAWLDATSAATITLELTSYGQPEAPVDTAGAANVWLPSGVTITGPTGAAIGGAGINVENVRQARARLKFVTTAISKLQVLKP